MSRPQPTMLRRVDPMLAIDIAMTDKLARHISVLETYVDACHLAKTVEYDIANDVFNCLADFAREHLVSKPVFFVFNDDLEYTAIDLLALWCKLTIGDRLRLVRRQWANDSQEQYDFRLLVFAVYNIALNVDDVFVICHRLNIVKLVPKMASLRLTHDAVMHLCRHLGLEYVDMRLKCQRYWMSWKLSHADITKTDFA